MDVSKDESVKIAADKLKSKGVKLYSIINNAGIWLYS